MILKKIFLLLLLIILNNSFFTTKASADTLNNDNIYTLINNIQQLTKEAVELNSGKIPRSLQINSKQSRTELLIQTIKKREDLLLKLAEEKPIIFLALAMKESTRNTFPRSLQNHIEQKVTIEGQLEVIHAINYSNEQPIKKTKFFIRTPKERIQFYPIFPIDIISETQARVSGFKVNNILVANTQPHSFQITKIISSSEAISDQKTLVLLIDFTDSGPRPFSKEEAAQLIFNGQFQNFMKEQSYQQISFSGDVYDWIRINAKGSELPFQQTKNICDLRNDTIGIPIKQFIVNQNIDLKKYDRWITLVNHPSMDGLCASVGKLSSPIWFQTEQSDPYLLSFVIIGLNNFNQPYNQLFSKSTLQWTKLDHKLALGISYNLGLPNARGWDCDDQIIYGNNCKEYSSGNYFDIMGTSLYSLHYNAFHKELLGWLKEPSIININQSGRYKIRYLEKPTTTSKYPRAAKIIIPSLNQSRNYTPLAFYIEFRKGVGFDQWLDNIELRSNQKGLLMHQIVNSRSAPFSYSRLLDMQPTTLNWQEDLQQATLNSNNTFRDEGLGLTIGPFIRENSGVIEFDVKIENPTCIRRPPLIMLNESSFPELLERDKSDFLVIIFYNQDSLACSPTNFVFQITSTIPIVSNLITDPILSHNINPQNIGYIIFEIKALSSATLGQSSLKIEIINQNNNLKTTQEIPIKIIPTPTITKIEPQSGPVGTSITIFGNDFIYGNSNNTFLSLMASSGQLIKFLPDSITNNTITAKLPSSYPCNINQSCSIIPDNYILQVQYKTNIKNINIQSNPINFVITSSQVYKRIQSTLAEIIQAIFTIFR
jgi:hypothetical protein